MTLYVEPYHGPWGWVFLAVLIVVILVVGWVLTRLAEHGEYEREEAEDIIENADMIDAIQRMFRAHLVEGLIAPVRREEALRDRMTRLKRMRRLAAIRRNLERMMPMRQAEANLEALAALRRELVGGE
jgi:hypothetical protein